MGYDQNLHELSMNMISRFTIYVIHEIHAWPFSLSYMILSDKLANCCVILCEITKIMGISRDQDFTI